MLLSHFSHVRPFEAPRIIARQAPLSMGFSRQEYWGGLPSLLQGPSWPRDRTRTSWVACFAGGFFSTEPLGKPSGYYFLNFLDFYLWQFILQTKYILIFLMYSFWYLWPIYLNDVPLNDEWEVQALCRKEVGASGHCCRPPLNSCTRFPHPPSPNPPFFFPASALILKQAARMVWQSPCSLCRGGVNSQIPQWGSRLEAEQGDKQDTRQSQGSLGNGGRLSSCQRQTQNRKFLSSHQNSGVVFQHPPPPPNHRTKQGMWIETQSPSEQAAVTALMRSGGADPLKEGEAISAHWAFQHRMGLAFTRT